MGDLPTSLLFIFPLYLVYEMGVVFSPNSLNGVDFVTEWVYMALGYDRMLYFWVHAGLAAVFVGVLLYMRRTRTFSISSWLPLVLESAIYALTLGTAILLVMDKALGFWLATALSDLGQSVIVSFGAGVHEELIFRLGLLGGGTAVLLRAGVPNWLAFVLALVVSSAVFSLAHHLGPTGDPWEMFRFIYRLLAGLAFGLIFYFRSLAHAVYAHAFYDVYVFVLRE